MKVALPGLSSSAVDSNGIFASAWTIFFTGIWNKLGRGSDIGLGGVIISNSTAVGSVGGGEDTLITYTLPKGLLGTTGDVLEIQAFGIFAANGNTKTVILYFGSTAIYTTTAVAANGGNWAFRAVITRTGAATQNVLATLDSSNATVRAVMGFNTAFTAATETLADALVVKCTGTGTADNDIVQKSLIVKYFPNGAL